MITLSNEPLSQLIVENYSIGEPIEIEPLHQGLNDLFKVECASGYEYVLCLTKSHTFADYTELMYREETSIINYLRKNHIPVPHIISKKDQSLIGKITIEEIERYYFMYEFIDGEHKSFNNFSGMEAFQLGQALAEMHKAFDRYNKPVKRFTMNVNLVKPVLSIYEERFGRTVDYEFLKETLLDVELRIKKYESMYPHRKGLIHGDFFTGNFLNETNYINILDFDFLSFGNRLYDIASLTSTDILHCSGLEIDSKLFQSFIRGYQSKNPISTGEFKFLEAFERLRLFFGLLYCLTESEKTISEDQFYSGMSTLIGLLRRWPELQAIKD